MDGVEGPAPIKFDGSGTADVAKFFFVYGNVIVESGPKRRLVRSFATWKAPHLPSTMRGLASIVF